MIKFNDSFLSSLNIAFIFFIIMSGTTLPTALYSIYQSQYGMTVLTITYIYASYVVGFILMLMIIRKWGNYLNFKYMLLVGIIFSMVCDLIFIFSKSVVLWTVARIISGFSAGIYISIATVMIIELMPLVWKNKAILLASASNMLGLGIGPLLGGYVLYIANNSIKSPYIFHFILLSFSFLASQFFIKNIKKNKSINKVQTKNLLLLPSQFKDIAALGLISFMVIGYYCSIIPSVFSSIFEINNNICVGWVIFLLFISSFFGQLNESSFKNNKKELFAILVLIVGLVVVGLSINLKSIYILVFATLLSGWGQGFIFKSSLESLNIITNLENRTKIISMFFIISYIGMSVPVVLLGFLSGFLGIFWGSWLYIIFIILSLIFIGRLIFKKNLLY